MEKEKNKRYKEERGRTGGKFKMEMQEKMEVEEGKEMKTEEEQM
jgi:hypothetical protein